MAEEGLASRFIGYTMGREVINHWINQFLDCTSIEKKKIQINET